MDKHIIRPTSDRLVHLDILRGFALLGILLVNFQWFVRPIQAIVLGPEADLTGANLMVDWFIRVLAEGKFYPLFSMLFGAGFALIAERAEAQGGRFMPIYLRRLGLLFLFGLAHMLLVWAGDILLIYALTGFLMVLLFRKTPVQRLWKWALVFFLVPILLMWLGALSIAASQLDPEIHESVIGGLEQDAATHREAVILAAEIQSTGSWSDNVGQRQRDMIFSLSNAIFWATPVMGFFLIGRWLILTGRLTRPTEHLMYFRRWRSRGLVLGLVLAVAASLLLTGTNMMVPTIRVAVGGTAAMAASILLALAYLSVVVLSHRRLQFLAPAGQMALTNYLCQSLFWTWMLYGHGLGLAESMPRASHLPAALLFFSAQVVFSHWWLGRFRYGPAEWLWRSLTYGQRQPMWRHQRAQ